MKLIKQYLHKQGKVDPLLSAAPAENLQMIVVIPAYKEVELRKTLESLKQCLQAPCGVEVIVYVNGSKGDDEAARAANLQSIVDCEKFISDGKSLPIRFHLISNIELELAKSGVGQARKVLMDEALFRLSQLGNRGLIVNLDADCTVQQDYLIHIWDYFLANPSLDAASIHFEHELSSEAIIDYELHLRYFIGMQKVLGLPFAFQTVGSAMVVRAEAYAAVGGMNTRRAGEDFYFLHKFIKNRKCGNLTNTTVFPSGRISDRVPFGTGKAVGSITDRGSCETYHPKSFEMLRPLVDDIASIFEGRTLEVDPALRNYLDSIAFEDQVLLIRKNTASFESFKKRYFQFFDAFKLMKCLHAIRDQGFEDVSLDMALNHYLRIIDGPLDDSRLQQLEFLRGVDVQ